MSVLLSLILLMVLLGALTALASLIEYEKLRGLVVASLSVILMLVSLVFGRHDAIYSIWKGQRKIDTVYTIQNGDTISIDYDYVRINTENKNNVQNQIIDSGRDTVFIEVGPE